MKSFLSFIVAGLLLAASPFLHSGKQMILFAQQSNSPPANPTTQTAPRTGRSYSTGDAARRPPPAAAQGQSSVKFTDITAQSGIKFRHAASPTSQKYLLESMGAGVALFDYDNDNRLDIYFTNGAGLRDPMPRGAQPDKSDKSYWNRLYHQKPDGTFEDVTERAGVRGSGYGMGVACADYDNDGFTDLYVTAYGSNTLYRNRGDGTFEDVTGRALVGGGGWSTSAGWFDYDRDGRLDLFVTRYAEWDFQVGAIYCGEQRPGMRAYCHPDNFRGATSLLYRQKEDNTFEDVSAKAGITEFAGKGLGVAFADFNSDGWTDVFVANDGVRQSLYMNRHNNTFEDIALLSGAGYDENGKTFAGMGADAADFDGDAQPDIFVTALSNETYPLFRNTGDETFAYVTNTTGLNRITLLYSGWGATLRDFDLDGWRDIFVAQSHVLDTIEKSSSYLQYKQTPLLARGREGKFTDVSASAGFTKPLTARGAAFGDLDNDGDTDIIVAVTDDAPVVYRNEGTGNHWIGFRLTGKQSNRSGIGARITITDGSGRKQIADLSTTGSYLAAHDSRVVFGLGKSDKVASVQVRWSNGKTHTIEDATIDRYQNITEK